MISCTNCSLDILCIHSSWCLNYISLSSRSDLVFFLGLGYFHTFFYWPAPCGLRLKKTFEDSLKPDQSALSLQLLNTSHWFTEARLQALIRLHKNIYLGAHSPTLCVRQHYEKLNQRWIRYNIYPCLLGINNVFPTEYPRKCAMSIGTVFFLKSIHIKYVWEVLN